MLSGKHATVKLCAKMAESPRVLPRSAVAIATVLGTLETPANVQWTALQAQAILCANTVEPPRVLLGAVRAGANHSTPDVTVKMLPRRTASIVTP